MYITAIIIAMIESLVSAENPQINTLATKRWIIADRALCESTANVEKIIVPTAHRVKIISFVSVNNSSILQVSLLLGPFLFNFDKEF